MLKKTPWFSRRKAPCISQEGFGNKTLGTVYLRGVSNNYDGNGKVKVIFRERTIVIQANHESLKYLLDQKIHITIQKKKKAD
jgi:hypothetical protein